MRVHTQRRSGCGCGACDFKRASHQGLGGSRRLRPRSETSPPAGEHDGAPRTRTGAVGATIARQVVALPAPRPLQSTAARALRSGGQPLASEVRASMEAAFAHDFSGVRIHADPHADRSAQALGARAYTVGQHVAFAEGQYRPQQPEGRRLLAHELAHVVQQRGAAPTAQGKALRVSSPSDPLEREADQTADRIMAGRPAGPLLAGPAVLARAVHSTSSNFPDPNNCFEPGGSRSNVDPSRTIAVMEARLEVPSACAGDVTMRTTVKDPPGQPGRAEGWFAVIRFSASNGGSLGNTLHTGSASGGSLHFLERFPYEDCETLNRRRFHYVRYPTDGRYTFVEAAYHAMAGGLSTRGGDTLVDGSSKPTIRLDPCNHLQPSP